MSPTASHYCFEFYHYVCQDLNMFLACWPLAKNPQVYTPAQSTLPDVIILPPTTLRSVVVPNASIPSYEFFDSVLSFGPAYVARYAINHAGVTFPSAEQASRCFEDLVAKGHGPMIHAVRGLPH